MQNLIESNVNFCAFVPNMMVFLVQLQERDGDRKLNIFIDEFTADVIINEINLTSSERPMTHDLFASVVKVLELKLDYVAVTSLTNNTYFAALFFRNGDGDIVEIDSRSSDAIAIGLKCSVPIYVKESVFAQLDMLREEGMESGDTLH